MISRRSFLRGSAAVSGVLSTGMVSLPALAQVGPTTPAGPDWVKVYVIVVDGLRPDELSQMPALNQLATTGFFYPDSRAQMIAETTPNHVSMITGMRADRHGMPGNDVAYLADNIGLEPRYLQCDTIYSLIARQAPELVTTAATSKEYIVQMSKHMRVDEGTEDADQTNDPFIVPVSGAAVDAEVGRDAVEQSRTLDPDFGWMSLGDVDRVGHSDQTGPSGGPPVARTVSLQTADRQVANLIDELQASGRWERSVVLITADHSMDWSVPNATVNLTGQFEDAPSLAGRTGVAQNGGAAIYWLLAPDAPEADAQRKAMRDIAVATEGVREAWYTRPNPADGGAANWIGATRPDWALAGDRTGDLVVVVDAGFRVTEPSPQSNPIPGNHGHVATLPIAQIVTGGWDGLASNALTPADIDLFTQQDDADVPPDVRLEAQGENIDLAPTIAWLLGINPPPGGFDGRVLSEAFTRRPDPRIPVVDVPSVPRYREAAGLSRQATAVALSVLAFPGEATDGSPVVPALVVASGRSFPDALAATPLAVSVGGPMLLTEPTTLDEVVAAEITRLAPETVFVVGGESAVSADVVAAIEALGVETVTRLSGPSRYATAAAVARQVVNSDSSDPGFEQDERNNGAEVIVASGESFPDALAAGPLAGLTGRLIVLTRPGGLPQETRELLEELSPARVLIAGGEAAVGASVEAELRTLSPSVERLGGSSRLATSARLVERTIREGGLTDRAFVVSAGGFPDALAAGAAVSRLGGMLVPLGDTLATSGEMADLLRARADGLVEVTYVGGTGVVSSELRDEVETAILERRTRQA